MHDAFLYISLASLHDCDGKMPNFKFYRGRNQATAKFSFSFWTWKCFLGNWLKKSSLAFDKVNELEYCNRDSDWKNANLIFERHFPALPSPSWYLKLPNEDEPLYLRFYFLCVYHWRIFNPSLCRFTLSPSHLRVNGKTHPVPKCTKMYQESEKISSLLRKRNP